MKLAHQNKGPLNIKEDKIEAYKSIDNNKRTPTKKQSSDKRRRIVNTRQNIVSRSSENVDKRSNSPSPRNNGNGMYVRPMSKTGLITDLHHHKIRPHPK